MKIRWNINEEQKKQREETKVSSDSKFPSAFKSFIPVEPRKEVETGSKPFPFYERQKRTHEQLENSNIFGGKNPMKPQNTLVHPLRLLNKDENLTDSKKMILIDKDFDEFNKKKINGNDLNWGQNQEKLNLNLPGEVETANSDDKEDENATTAIFHLESFLKLDENLIEHDKNISNNNTACNKIPNNEYFIEKKIKFPEIIFELLNANQDENVNSFTGMFSQLNLLYFVKNEIIYFWDFEQNKIYTFKEIPTKILYIHFATPKQGIFAPDITHITIVATTDEIYIILIRRNDDYSYSFIKSDFIVEIGDYYITAICSSSEGRVFLGSQNHNLYELDYSNSYSFFGFFKRANKIIHSAPSIFNKLIPFFLKQSNYIAKLEIDDTRHILYCLVYYTNDQNLFKFENVSYSSLIIYDLGPDGTQFKKLGEINQESICERYNQLNMRQEKEKNFIIKEIFPFTRKDSKYYHLIIITKNGLRVYISFDIEITNEFIENEEIKNEKNPNLIYRCRPTMKYSIVLKQLPEPTNSSAFDYKVNDRAFRVLSAAAEKSEKQVFYVDHKFVLFYKDEFRKQAFLDVVEFDDTVNLKGDLSMGSNVNANNLYGYAVSPLNQNLNINTQLQTNPNNFIYQENNPVFNPYQTFSPYNKTNETITNILNFDFNKEIHGFCRNSQIRTKSDNFLDLESLLKTNGCFRSHYLDSDEFVSIDFMNRFSKQIFQIPEQYILFTSSDLIFINKKRPIDELFKIILESEGVENSKNPLPNEFVSFINKYGISETSYMLLVIFANYGLKFNLYEEAGSSMNPSFDGFAEAKENLEKFNKNLFGMDIVNSSGAGSAGINMSNIGSAGVLGRTNTFMRQVKNNEGIMKKAFDFYMRLIDFETVVDNKNMLAVIENLNFAERDRNLEQFGNQRYNLGKEMDNIGRPIVDLPNLKINHITYSLFMYISRLVRIFWEEPFYFRIGDTKDNFLSESFRISQLENLLIIISDFTQILSSKKSFIIQKCSEFQLKKNTQTQNLLKTNPQSSSVPTLLPANSLASFDSAQITQDLEEILSLSQRLSEALKFIFFFYNFPALKAHLYSIPKNIQNALLSYKYKDLVKKANLLILQNWIEELFDLALKENDCAAVSEKLDEMSFVCPRLLGAAQKEIITANMLVKYADDRQTNSIARKNMIDKAVQLMLKNPYKIRLEYVIKVLGDNHKIPELIRVCVLKSSYLKKFLDEDYLETFSGLSVAPQAQQGMRKANEPSPGFPPTANQAPDYNYNFMFTERDDNYVNRNANLLRTQQQQQNYISNTIADNYNYNLNPNLESDAKLNFYNNYNYINRSGKNVFNPVGNLNPTADNRNKLFPISGEKPFQSEFGVSYKKPGYPLSSNTASLSNPLNSSFTGRGFENIYDLNNLENNYNFCEFKKCIYTILKFLEEINNSIKTHKKTPKKTSTRYITENPNDSFSDFFYNNLKEISEKVSEQQAQSKFSLFSLFKKLGFAAADKAKKPALPGYAAEEELIGNLIKEIIHHKFWDFSLEDKIELQNLIIEEVLKHEKFKFLHILIFDHFKSKGMTEEILKYKSPYIEEYLKKNAMEKDDYSDLKTNNSLISFYINDKNYLKAFDILIKLAYQDNRNLSAENYVKNAVNVSKRIEYLKKANFLLEKLLREKGDEEKKNFYASFKEKINKKIDVLEIQNEILFNLKKVINHQLKINSGVDLGFYEELVSELNFNVFDIEELYFNYAAKFKLHEIKIMILFENFTKKNPAFLTHAEVRNVYADAIEFYVNKDGENYPQSLISLLITIFVLYIKNHTDFHNFYDAYRHSGPDHSIKDIIPLDFIINLIENFNWQKIYNQSEIDLEKFSKERFDKPNNPFWLILFLNEKANIPIHLIYKYYVNLKNNEEFKNQKEIIIQMALVFIINKWCNRIEEYIQKLNTTSVKISKDLFADYQEFVRSEGFINNFFNNIYLSLENNAVKIRQDFILDSNINYIKNVEKKFNSIVKRSLATSAKFRTPSLYSDDSMLNYTDSRLRIPEFDLNRREFESQKNVNYGRSNTATNFETRNNLLLENDIQRNRMTFDASPRNNFDLGSKKDKNLNRNNLFNEDDI